MMHSYSTRFGYKVPTLLELFKYLLKLSTYSLSMRFRTQPVFLVIY